MRRTLCQARQGQTRAARQLSSPATPPHEESVRVPLDSFGEVAQRAGAGREIADGCLKVVAEGGAPLGQAIERRNECLCLAYRAIRVGEDATELAASRIELAATINKQSVQIMQRGGDVSLYSPDCLVGRLQSSGRGIS